MKNVSTGNAARQLPPSGAQEQDSAVQKIVKLMSDSNNLKYLLPRQDSKNQWNARMKLLLPKHECQSRATSLLECKRNTGPNPLSTISGI